MANTQTLEKYAQLLSTYCLETKPGQKVLVRSTPLAEPLLQHVYKELLQKGCHVEFQLSFNEQDKLFFDHANDDQLKSVSDLYKHAVETYDKFIAIQAPYNLKSTASVSPEKRKIAAEGVAPYKKKFMERSAKKDVEWVLCVYPTQALAQEAGMSLSDYATFVFNACHLDKPDPTQAWLDVRAFQQRIVDRLNQASSIRYVSRETDISFSTKGRTWLNSDGRRNMPSGEVYTSPVEDSVNGTIKFSYPSIHGGREVKGVTLWAENGVIVKWDADEGRDYLDYIFSVPGANRFGEAAIGLNQGIQKMTKNILFDEKIGGTVHMAIGASYPDAGGKNESSVHWDMITDMTAQGQIFADNALIYENGTFIEA